jgi:hypothetical protein
MSVIEFHLLESCLLLLLLDTEVESILIVIDGGVDVLDVKLPWTMLPIHILLVNLLQFLPYLLPQYSSPPFQS